MDNKQKEGETWRVKDELGLAGYSKQLSKSRKKVERLPMIYMGSIENDPMWKSRKQL